MVAGATYAGTSSLFAAYLSGLMVSWFDGLVAELRTRTPSSPSNSGNTGSNTDTSHGGGVAAHEGNNPTHDSQETPHAPQKQLPTGEKVYERYYQKPVDRILIPMFFVSFLPIPLGTC